MFDLFNHGGIAFTIARVFTIVMLLLFAFFSIWAYRKGVAGAVEEFFTDILKKFFTRLDYAEGGDGTRFQGRDNVIDASGGNVDKKGPMFEGTPFGDLLQHVHDSREDAIRAEEVGDVDEHGNARDVNGRSLDAKGFMHDVKSMGLAKALSNNRVANRTSEDIHNATRINPLEEKRTELRRKMENEANQQRFMQSARENERARDELNRGLRRDKQNEALDEASRRMSEDPNTFDGMSAQTRTNARNADGLNGAEDYRKMASDLDIKNSSDYERQGRRMQMEYFNAAEEYENAKVNETAAENAVYDAMFNGGDVSEARANHAAAMAKTDSARRKVNRAENNMKNLDESFKHIAMEEGIGGIDHEISDSGRYQGNYERTTRNMAEASDIMARINNNALRLGAHAEGVQGANMSPRDVVDTQRQIHVDQQRLRQIGTELERDGLTGMAGDVAAVASHNAMDMDANREAFRTDNIRQAADSFSDKGQEFGNHFRSNYIPRPDIAQSVSGRPTREGGAQAGSDTMQEVTGQRRQEVTMSDNGGMLNVPTPDVGVDRVNVGVNSAANTAVNLANMGVNAAVTAQKGMETVVNANQAMTNAQVEAGADMLNVGVQTATNGATTIAGSMRNATVQRTQSVNVTGDANGPELRADGASIHDTINLNTSTTSSGSTFDNLGLTGQTRTETVNVNRSTTVVDGSTADMSTAPIGGQQSEVTDTVIRNKVVNQGAVYGNLGTEDYGDTRSVTDHTYRSTSFRMMGGQQGQAPAQGGQVNHVTDTVIRNQESTTVNSGPVSRPTVQGDTRQVMDRVIRQTDTRYQGGDAGFSQVRPGQTQTVTDTEIRQQVVNQGSQQSVRPQVSVTGETRQVTDTVNRMTETRMVDDGMLRGNTAEAGTTQTVFDRQEHRVVSNLRPSRADMVPKADGQGLRVTNHRVNYETDYTASKAPNRLRPQDLGFKSGEKPGGRPRR